jgi:hypothetical protein
MITPEAIDKLKDELGGIFMVTKTHHYKQGQKYGHLASAIPEKKYRLIIRNATWAHTVPGNPGAYLQAALSVGNSAALQEQHVVEHKILQKSYNDYLGVEEVGEELILYAVGNDALAPLKKLFHTDQTGAFPFTSQHGNRYIMVAIHLDANYIFVEPMRSRSKEEMIRAYEEIINRMKAAGLGLRKHTPDNEASDAFKQYIYQQQI